jgi:para-aminobenzoate synthetase component 1
VAALSRRPGFFWLESGLVRPPLGRFSFAGAEPWAVVRAWGRRVEVDVRRAVLPDVGPGRRVLQADPLAALRAWLPAAPADAEAPVPFAGGAVGVLGYELGALLPPLAPLDRPGRDGLDLPDLCFLLVDRVLAWDHADARGFALGLGVGRDSAAAAAAAAAAAREVAAAGAGAPRPWEAPPDAPPDRRARAHRLFDEASHAKAVARILDAVAAGDVYQACLTHRLDAPCAGDPLRLYGALRRLNPAPFAAFLDLPDAALVSSSPERFLRVAPDGAVESRPIKGTRRRGAGPAADRAEAAALAASEKDRAENLMIVDLVRNDLGRVCATGSVHVPELFAVETYAAVHQLVSTVRGRLRPECDALDAVAAAFPPGSMTGAPKRAAVQLLARLEPVRRGFYAGALGYLDARGGCDLSVVIRSAIVKDGRAYVHTGGGIVADSDPAAEWREAEDKVAPLLAALSGGTVPPARLRARSRSRR